MKDKSKIKIFLEKNCEIGFWFFKGVNLIDDLDLKTTKNPKKKTTTIKIPEECTHIEIDSIKGHFVVKCKKRIEIIDEKTGEKSFDDCSFKIPKKNVGLNLRYIPYLKETIENNVGNHSYVFDLMDVRDNEEGYYDISIVLKNDVLDNEMQFGDGCIDSFLLPDNYYGTYGMKEGFHYMNYAEI